MKRNKKLIAGIVGTLIIGEAFVGKVDWKSIFSLEKTNKIRLASHSIATGNRTVGNSTYRCNYWAVGKRLVITNGHCSDNGDVTGTVIKFTESDKLIRCEEALAYEPWSDENGMQLDYTLIKCDSDVPAPLQFDTRDLVEGEKLIHISHNCDYYSNVNCTVEAKFDDSEDCKVFNPSVSTLDFSFGCDSLGGSSGSPVFSKDLKVVGLHHSGYFYNDERGTVEGKGYQNGAIKIKLVLESLKAKGYDLVEMNKTTIKPKPTTPEIKIFDFIVSVLKYMISLLEGSN